MAEHTNSWKLVESEGRLTVGVSRFLVLQGGQRGVRGGGRSCLRCGRGGCLGGLELGRSPL